MRGKNRDRDRVSDRDRDRIKDEGFGQRAD